MRTKPFHVILAFFLCLSLGFPTQRQVFLRFPVKWANDMPLKFQPVPGSFRLTINGRVRQIQKVVANRDVLKATTDLKRNVVMGFQIGEYTPGISEAVAYFVYQILNPGDHLIVLSPLKSHYLVVGKNKEKVIRDIEGSLKPECETFNHMQRSSEKKLRSLLVKLDQTLGDSPMARGIFSNRMYLT